ncbi:hypothetical protein K5X82_03265 [Halosquirtibacter xylanolyticus]|uniref:hypothetical protein n=1 Tax=Halosquirtibacter xylanolyticus TaxID=3374599 RepID=UPI003748B516|nr:hypothetical protein K5X82_03265 [Prolixibacteraceae bacterium]
MGILDSAKQWFNRENVDKAERGIVAVHQNMDRVVDIVHSAKIVKETTHQVVGSADGYVGDYLKSQKNNHDHQQKMTSILSSHHENMVQIEKKYDQQNMVLDKSFDVIDRGLEDNNIALVAEGLKSSTQIAMSNPFEKELEALDRAIDDPDALIEI